MDRTVYERMNALETQHWWFVARRRIIATLIRRFLPPTPAPVLLEAGCGSGGNLAMLGDFGRLQAFEFDDAARAQAAAKSGLDVAFGALPDRIPFAPQRYDLIGIFDVLEHVEADSRALTALADRLADGGRLLITVPACPFLWSEHDVRNHHFRRYTRASLEQALQDAGLEVVYLSHFNAFLFPLAALSRLVKKVTGSKEPDDRMPGPTVNALLTRVFGLERHLIGRFRLPFGLSLVAAARRP